jgi:hypothetical protein
VFLPLFAVGNSGTTFSFNDYVEFMTAVNADLATPTPVTELTARGTYNPGTNIFTASAIDVVVL